MALLEVGAAAPDFNLPDQDGNMVSMADLKGSKLVMWFFPKANPPG